MTQPHEQHDESANEDDRRPYRPPVGMPLRGEGRWGAPFSIVVHIVLILVLVMPVFARVVAPELFPGGGLGPAGGGGGGTGGLGGWRPQPIDPEGLRYIRVAPEPPPQETAEAETAIPEQEEEPPPPEPEPEPAQEEEAQPETPPQSAAPVPGTGGGTGNDGTSGTGPGTGGGTGSGVGTGTGSADGPGTGGGEGRDYLPTPELLVLAPDAPNRLKGKVITVTFTLNERGDVLRVDFPSTGDRGYDRRLRERMNEMRFRPAVGPDGQPMAATYPVKITL